MFFRREKPRQLSFDDYLGQLRQFGFEIQSLGSGKARAVRRGFAAVIEENGGRPRYTQSGVVVGDEIAHFVDAGYQKFFLTDGGRRVPALAQHLKAMHAFEEDLKEGLGISSLYNEGLGTTFDRHVYDRVKNRDSGGEEKPWLREPGGR